MSLDERLAIGETIRLGSHTFGAEEIKAFAAKFDPQPFHLDEEAAKASVFGRLCASGWHTVSTWMKYYAAMMPTIVERSKAFGEPIEFGPAAGIRDLKWFKPVYAGDTISFTRKAVSQRPLASRPGWRMVAMENEALDADGAVVMRFTTMVLMKTG
ncbi:MaoC family dehydratase [Aquibium carbonis]|uniref:MaoC family dehydratase n=1 Tax=Aquibium carbonis TaxID=2495581 RepID=A0A429Z2S1_9HYPH|nr:MaoC family dehydratase [Aquibium carbonis]RST87993.1 MaoC family dehydratase [Aquibium carbonis]